jgi:hypothetical protein
MAKSLTEAEFKHWQSIFYRHFWNGRELGCREALYNALADNRYLKDGTVFCSMAGAREPSTIQTIALNKRSLVDASHIGRFAAVYDQFVVIQANRVHNFYYEECEKYAIGWWKQKIVARISVRRQGELYVLMNTWVPRNILQRFLRDDAIDALEDLNEKALGIILGPLQDIVGRDVDPSVVNMYQEHAQSLASFLRTIIHRQFGAS